MEMNIDVYTRLYTELKESLKQNLSDYGVEITKLSKKQSDRFPLVVFTEEDNVLDSSTLRREETTSKLYYEINIYARDKVINEEKCYAIDIARQISAEVDKVLNKKYRMDRLFCRPTPNLDDSIYRITMRYSVGLNDNRVKFI
jgi:hypothetical protein